MKKELSIYLAGPDVFREKEKMEEVSENLKAVCRDSGNIGHFPMDNVLVADDGDYESQDFSFKIFRSNILLIDKSDVVIANLQNFRSPGIDDGTAFEIGYGFAKGKIIYGYSPTCDIMYPELCKLFMKKIKPEYASELMEEFPVIEAFKGNTANLMLVGSIHDSGGAIFKTFKECVAHLTKR